MRENISPERQCIRDGECRPKHQSSKDTKTWCKGREGMAHEWHWVVNEFWNGLPRFRERCVEVLILCCRECQKRSYVNRYRCRECFTPMRSGGLVTHGEFCSFKDYRFFSSRWAFTLADLEAEAREHGYRSRLFHHLGEKPRYVTAVERFEAAKKLLAAEHRRHMGWE